MAASRRKKKLNQSRLAGDLRNWRKRNKLSQSAAALELKLSKRTLQGWEHGRHEPRGLGLVALRDKIGH